MQSNSSTTTRHHGHWARSLRGLACEACCAHIPAGDTFLFFPWFPGRQHKVACFDCAKGPVPSGPSLSVVAEAALEVAA